MKSLALKILVAFLALAVVTTAADAQRSKRKGRGSAAAARPEIGGHAGYNFDAEVAFAGAQAAIPVANKVDFYPSFSYYFVSDATEWALNFDARLRPQVANRNGYLGAGINLLYYSVTGSSDTQTNVNLFGGIEGRRGGIRPFAEARLIFGHGTTFQVQGGLNFPLR